jgi:hypothetical protein
VRCRCRGRDGEVLIMRRRCVPWVLAGVVVVLPPAAAHAGPRACSPLVVDARGDTEAGLAPGAPDRPDLDLLAVDLGVRGDSLIVTASMAAPSPSVPVPAGLIDITFDIGSTTYNAYKWDGVDGTIYGFNNAAGGHTVTGTSGADGVVRINVPRRLIPAASGSKVSDLEAVTYEYLGTNEWAYGDSRDSARTRRIYRLGSRGCL